MNQTEFQKKYIELARALEGFIGEELKFTQANTPYMNSYDAHIRTGLAMTMIDHGALAALLIKKGLITQEEVNAQVIDVLEKEKKRYESILELVKGAQKK